MKYTVIIETTQTGYSGYIPDLEGCAATAPTKEKLLEYLKEGALLHIEGLSEQNIKAPTAITESVILEIE